MAFKFPGSKWQEKAGFSRSMITDEDKCAVCDSSHDLGWNPEWSVSRMVCQRHSNCQDFVVQAIAHFRDRKEKITQEQWASWRLNSWDRDALIPYMSDAVLIWNTEYTLQNVTRFLNPSGPASTYDEALQLYAKELVKRYYKETRA